MDQETHDAAVRTVIAGLRAHADKYDGSLPTQRALADEHLSLARTISERLSPPAKPEAKLEALPTEKQWREVSSGREWDDEPNARWTALADGVLAGTVKIVDERGKGAEAERLDVHAGCKAEVAAMREGLDAAVHCEKWRFQGTGRDDHSYCYNKTRDALRRAERFPGER